MKIQDDVWEAEKLLRRRRRNGQCEYLVKWRNYPLRDSTWEPEENILDTGLLAHFNYSLKMKTRGIGPVRGRPRKRSAARSFPWANPPKRPRHDVSERGHIATLTSSTPRVRGRPRGRPRLQPLLAPVRERNRKPNQELDGSDEWLPGSEDEDENEDVEEEVEEDEEDRENVGRRRRSARISGLRYPPVRRRPLAVTPGQGALSGLKRRDLVLTDVTWAGVTVTIKEEIGQSKSAASTHCM